MSTTASMARATSTALPRAAYHQRLGWSAREEPAHAEHDAHHRHGVDGEPDRRTDTLGDPQRRQHEREHDVHQQAAHRGDEHRGLERLAGTLGGARRSVGGEAQQASHQPVGRRPLGDGDGEFGGAAVNDMMALR